MKNPFKKEKHSDFWLAGVVTGALVAAAGILFYLQRKRAAEQEAYRKEHAQDYLEDMHPHKPKLRTDLHELHTIVPHQG